MKDHTPKNWKTEPGSAWLARSAACVRQIKAALKEYLAAATALRSAMLAGNDPEEQAKLDRYDSAIERLGFLCRRAGIEVKSVLDSARL